MQNIKIFFCLLCLVSISHIASAFETLGVIDSDQNPVRETVTLKQVIDKSWMIIARDCFDDSEDNIKAIYIKTVVQEAKTNPTVKRVLLDLLSTGITIGIFEPMDLLTCLKDAAQQGDVVCQNNFATYLKNGFSCKPATDYRVTDAEGSVTTMRDIHDDLIEDQSIKPDYERAIYWYEAATCNTEPSLIYSYNPEMSHQARESAKIAIADFYLHGVVKKQNFDVAKNLYQEVLDSPDCTEDTRANLLGSIDLCARAKSGVPAALAKIKEIRENLGLE